MRRCGEKQNTIRGPGAAKSLRPDSQRSEERKKEPEVSRGKVCAGLFRLERASEVDDLKTEELLGILSSQPIIASVKNDEELEQALQSDVGVIFLLYGTILSVGELTQRVHQSGKQVFVHLDMVEGLAPKEVAADFIARTTAADGVISTKAQLTRRARELGLVAIQRFFLLDSKAMSSMEQFSPGAADVVEVLPGLMPKAIHRVARSIRRPVIAGGLIQDKEDVITALSAGAVAVSTTNPQVWAM